MLGVDTLQRGVVPHRSLAPAHHAEQPSTLGQGLNNAGAGTAIVEDRSKKQGEKKSLIAAAGWIFSHVELFSGD